MSSTGDILQVEWEPGWYSADPDLRTGVEDYFVFEGAEVPTAPHPRLRFHTDINSGDEALCARARIRRIEHPTLGVVQGVVHVRFHCYVKLVSGVVYRVDTEEHPGQLITDEVSGPGLPRREPPVDSWAMVVELELLEPLQMRPHRQLERLWKDLGVEHFR